MPRQKQSGRSALKAGLLCNPIVIDLSESAAETLWNDGEVGHDCFDLGEVTPAKLESLAVFLRQERPRKCKDDTEYPWLILIFEDSTIGTFNSRKVKLTWASE